MELNTEYRILREKLMSRLRFYTRVPFAYLMHSSPDSIYIRKTHEDGLNWPD